jgi:hypothetical protein
MSDFDPAGFLASEQAKKQKQEEREHQRRQNLDRRERMAEAFRPFLAQIPNVDHSEDERLILSPDDRRRVADAFVEIGRRMRELGFAHRLGEIGWGDSERLFAVHLYRLGLDEDRAGIVERLEGLAETEPVRQFLVWRYVRELRDDIANSDFVAPKEIPPSETQPEVAAAPEIRPDGFVGSEGLTRQLTLRDLLTTLRNWETNRKQLEQPPSVILFLDWFPELDNHLALPLIRHFARKLLKAENFTFATAAAIRDWLRAERGLTRAESEGMSLQDLATTLKEAVTTPEPADLLKSDEHGDSDATPETVTQPSRDVLLRRMEPAARLAYLAYCYAEAKVERRLEDREAFDWLKENGFDEDAGELVEYQLPRALDTWTRQLRSARNLLGEQKYTRRRGRSYGSSVVRQDEID